MATPLFVQSEAVIVARLRLSAVPDTALDTKAIIDEGILRARLRFYTELGVARTNELAAQAHTDTPTNEEQVLRALASTTEIKMVYCYLLRALPNTFMDASGDVNKRWQEEAPTRERGGFDLDAEILRCENEVTADLLRLVAPNDLACDEVQVFDGDPPCPQKPGTAPHVGLSLKPGIRRCSTDS